MAVETDQSGKFEQLDTHTVIACSNEKTSAIWLSAQTKRLLTQKLRKTLIPHNDLVAITFAVLVFILLDNLDVTPTAIIIDEEYTDKDNIIRESLRKLINNKTKGKWEGIIRFKQIGKLSPAHRAAWTIHRKRRFLDIKKLSEADVLKFFL